MQHVIKGLPSSAAVHHVILLNAPRKKSEVFPVPALLAFVDQDLLSGVEQQAGVGQQGEAAVIVDMIQCRDDCPGLTLYRMEVWLPMPWSHLVEDGGLAPNAATDWPREGHVVDRGGHDIPLGQQAGIVGVEAGLPRRVTECQVCAIQAEVHNL